MKRTGMVLGMLLVLAAAAYWIYSSRLGRERPSVAPQTDEAMPDDQLAQVEAEIEALKARVDAERDHLVELTELRQRELDREQAAYDALEAHWSRQLEEAPNRAPEAEQALASQAEAEAKAKAALLADVKKQIEIVEAAKAELAEARERRSALHPNQ